MSKPTTKKGPLKLYKSYIFKEKDPVIDQLRTVVQDSKKSYGEIHALSGVSVSAINGWFNGVTKRPQFATVNAVASALGQEFKLTKK